MLGACSSVFPAPRSGGINKVQLSDAMPEAWSSGVAGASTQAFNWFWPRRCVIQSYSRLYPATQSSKLIHINSYAFLLRMHMSKPRPNV